jgi:glyoxylase-like metal-dependent hydrolase (beta-lactamase superfamily II)
MEYVMSDSQKPAEPPDLHAPSLRPRRRVLAVREQRGPHRARGDPAPPAPDNDPTKPAPEETFADHRTLEIGGERIELAWHGANHSPDNIYIHFPDHDTLMLVDIVLPGWVPFCMDVHP